MWQDTHLILFIEIEWLALRRDASGKYTAIFSQLWRCISDISLYKDFDAPTRIPSF